MPYDSFHKSNLPANLVKGFSSLKSGRERLGLDLALNVMDKNRRAKIDAANHGQQLDNIEALEELAAEIDTYLALTRRPVRDGVPLTSSEAVELCEVSEAARPLTIALRHAQRATGAGPLNRHHEHMRHRKCSTSNQGD